MSRRGPRDHLVIPDTQIRAGVPLDHLEWIARYALEHRPDVIVQLGDWYDFPSLSSYDTATHKALAGADVRSDLEAGHEGWERFEGVIRADNRRKNSKRRYKPTRYWLLGNHENRLQRALQDQPWLRGLVAGWQQPATSKGWRPVPFLQPLHLDGVSYCHYFVRSASGSVTQSRRGQPSAKAQVVREGASTTAGHRQGLDVHVQPTSRGLLRGVIAGSCYQHEEEYLTPQGVHYWRGIIHKRRVRNGYYDLTEISLDTLRELYG